MINDPKVCFPIIQFVTVDMIRVHTLWRVGDLPVHVNSFLDPILLDLSRGISSPYREPVELVKVIKPVIVYYCVLSVRQLYLLHADSM